MLLVFFIILSILVLLIFSRIRISIENFSYTNVNKTRKTSNNFEIKIKIYILKYLKIFNVKLNREKMKKIKIKQKIEKEDIERIKLYLPKSNKEKLEIIKSLKIDISKLKVYLQIGTGNVLLTSYVVSLLSTVFSIIFTNIVKKKKNTDYYYRIHPLYENENLYNIKLDCIINIKTIHIICMLYNILKRKRVDKNVRRTSNRGFNEYRYE